MFLMNTFIFRFLSGAVQIMYIIVARRRLDVVRNTGLLFAIIIYTHVCMRYTRVTPEISGDVYANVRHAKNPNARETRKGQTPCCRSGSVAGILSSLCQNLTILIRVSLRRRTNHVYYRCPATFGRRTKYRIVRGYNVYACMGCGTSYYHFENGITR